MENDCYTLLSIPSDADERSIRKAFRLKTKEKHPDVNDSAIAALEFMNLKNAVDILLDPVKRLQHDKKFGYALLPKNQDSNAKQKFTTAQEERAKDLVGRWASDHTKVANATMEERRKSVAAYKKKVRIAMIIFWILVAGAVVFLLSRH